MRSYQQANSGCNPASGAKFDVVDTPDTPFFYIRVATIRLHPASACASAITTQVFVTQKVTLTFSNIVDMANILLWERAFIGSSSPENHPDLVKKDVEDLTKGFITEWNLSNKKTE